MYRVTNRRRNSMLLQLTQSSGSAVMVPLMPNQTQVLDLHDSLLNRPTIRKWIKEGTLGMEKVEQTSAADLAAPRAVAPTPSPREPRASRRAPKTDVESDKE